MGVYYNQYNILWEVNQNGCKNDNYCSISNDLITNNVSLSIKSNTGINNTYLWNNIDKSNENGFTSILFNPIYYHNNKPIFIINEIYLSCNNYDLNWNNIKWLYELSPQVNNIYLF